MAEKLVRQDAQRRAFGAVSITDTCPSCGLPFRDDIERPYLNAENPEQTARREAEDAAYKERHKDCYGVRVSYGNGPCHCGGCCPMPPMSSEVRTKVTAIPRARLPAADRRGEGRLPPGHDAVAGASVLWTRLGT